MGRVLNQNNKIGSPRFSKIEERNVLGPGSYEVRAWEKKGFRFGQKERGILPERNKNELGEEINNKSIGYGKIEENKMDAKKHNEKIKKRGSSFGKEATFWDKRKMVSDLGPGRYELNLPSSKVGCKFKKDERFKSADELKKRPASPPSLESDEDAAIPDSEMIKKWKELKMIELENEKMFTHYKKFNPSMRKKKETLKERALKLIEQTVQRIEEKEKLEQIRKKNIGFTSLQRKNEFLDPQAIFKSPGPIYNLRDSISYSKSVKFPIDMRKELFFNEQGPGPGSYEIPSIFNMRMERRKEKYI